MQKEIPIEKNSVRDVQPFDNQEDVVIYKSAVPHSWLSWDALSPWASGSPPYIQRL